MHETKEEILETIVDQDKPKCPHCSVEMTLWEVPPIPMGDGLGWGTPYLFVCFNDECQLYGDGWANMAENFGHSASYRCICYPGTENFECMTVFGAAGAKGQIIDDRVLADQEMLKEATKIGFSILAECYVKKDSPTMLNLLFDPAQPSRVRAKAGEMLGDTGESEAIGLMVNAKFGNKIVQKTVDEAVKKIHARNFTRECPFCAEIIKRRAKICKHCDRDVAGL